MIPAQFKTAGGFREGLAAVEVPIAADAQARRTKLPAIPKGPDASKWRAIAFLEAMYGPGERVTR